MSIDIVDHEVEPKHKKKKNQLIPKNLFRKNKEIKRGCLEACPH